MSKSCYFYLPLFAAIVLLSVPPVSGQIVPLSNGQAGVRTDASVNQVTYLEDRVSSLEASLQTGAVADTYTSPFRRAYRDSPGIVGGYDLVVFAPHFSNGISYQLRDIAGTDTAVYTYGYPTAYKMAPRFWLGYQGQDGLGVRARYMQYDQHLLAGSLTTDATRTAFFDGLSASNGQVLSFGTGMELHVLDFDVVQDFEVWRAKLAAGAGLRYARLQFDYAATTNSNGGALQYQSTGESGFEGIGPTAFIDFQAPIRRSNLSVVGGLRGSVLFGKGNDRDYVSRIIAPVYTSLSTENAERSTGVIEATIGLQYERSLSGGIDAFVRCAWEGQLWMDVGSPVQSSGDMALEGLCVAFGITR